jgi:hypothetical protein
MRLFQQALARVFAMVALARRMKKPATDMLLAFH